MDNGRRLESKRGAVAPLPVIGGSRLCASKVEKNPKKKINSLREEKRVSTKPHH